MGNLNYMHTFQYHRLVIQKNGVKLNGTTLHCSLIISLVSSYLACNIHGRKIQDFSQDLM